VGGRRFEYRIRFFNFAGKILLRGWHNRKFYRLIKLLESGLSLMAAIRLV
jgi:hypothetical protein